MIDPRRIDVLNTPHADEGIHLALRPGTNVAIINALAHVIVTEGLEDHDFIKQRCDTEAYSSWRSFIVEERNSPEMLEKVSGVPAEKVREAARIYAQANNAAIYYG